MIADLNLTANFCIFVAKRLNNAIAHVAVVTYNGTTGAAAASSFCYHSVTLDCAL